MFIVDDEMMPMRLARLTTGRGAILLLQGGSATIVVGGARSLQRSPGVDIISFCGIKGVTFILSVVYSYAVLMNCGDFLL